MVDSEPADNITEDAAEEPDGEFVDFTPLANQWRLDKPSSGPPLRLL